MSDIREAILARLAIVARGVSGVSGAYRNGAEIDESKLPCILIWDGAEMADDGDIKAPPTAPRRVTMRPDVWVLVASDSDTIGTQMNLYRRRLIKAVMEDSTLSALTANAPNLGGVRYEGCEPDLSRGRQTNGEMRVKFAFTYPLRASDL